jgi:uncharacterized membrane protein
MEPFTIFKFLHVLSMFGAVTLLVGTTIYVNLVFRRRDPATIAAIGPIASRVALGGIILAILGVVFGLLAAMTGSFDMTAGWLLFAYAIVVILFVLGSYEGRLMNRVGEVAARSEGTASTELAQALDDWRLPAIAVVSIVLYVLVIFDMIAKPF